MFPDDWSRVDSVLMVVGPVHGMEPSSDVAKVSDGRETKGALV